MYLVSPYNDGLGAGRPGLDSRQRQNISLLHRVQPGSGAHTSSYTMGIGDSFPESRVTGSEVDHSPPFSARVKMIALHFHSPLCLHGLLFNYVKYRDNFLYIHPPIRLHGVVLVVNHRGQLYLLPFIGIILT
jgi:hypothetical protein